MGDAGKEEEGKSIEGQTSDEGTPIEDATPDQVKEHLGKLLEEDPSRADILQSGTKEAIKDDPELGEKVSKGFAPNPPEEKKGGK